MNTFHFSFISTNEGYLIFFFLVNYNITECEYIQKIFIFKNVIWIDFDFVDFKNKKSSWPLNCELE